MNERPDVGDIWLIVRDGLPDRFGITAEEYFEAGWQHWMGSPRGIEFQDITITCFERSAKMGYDRAMIFLAHLYRDYGMMDEYYRWILEAAMMGEDGSAFLELGELYFTGEYVHRDYKKAYQYFMTANEFGAHRCKYYLAYFADRGILESRDEETAIRYYLEGAKEYDERCWKRLKELGVEY